MDKLVTLQNLSVVKAYTDEGNLLLSNHINDVNDNLTAQIDTVNRDLSSQLDELNTQQNSLASQVDSLYLRCNEEQYALLTEAQKSSFLIAIVDEMADLDNTDLYNLTNILNNDTSTEMVMDISENEAIAITDEIIGGTK
jgi:seryl-tRNA synthetase